MLFPQVRIYDGESLLDIELAIQFILVKYRFDWSNVWRY